MKYALSILIIFFLSISIYSQEQDTTAGKTAIQKFSNQYGTILTYEYARLGDLQPSGWLAKPVKLEALKITSASDGSHRVGLRIILASPLKNDNDVVTFLDLSEVKALYDGMKYMQNVIATWKGKTMNYTEVRYNTLDDFECGIYKNEDKIKMFFKINKYPYPSSYFGEEDIPGILTIIEKAISSMETLDSIAAK